MRGLLMIIGVKNVLKKVLQGGRSPEVKYSIYFLPWKVQLPENTTHKPDFYAIGSNRRKWPQNGQNEMSFPSGWSSNDVGSPYFSQMAKMFKTPHFIASHNYSLEKWELILLGKAVMRIIDKRPLLSHSSSSSICS